MCMSHLTGSKSPPSTCGHWEHLSIHHTHTFGANSSSFYWPVENVHSGGAQGSPRAPWLCQSPFCHGHQAAPHPLLCLPEGRAQPPASLNGQSHDQEAGTNNQQLDFHSTESNTPRKWNLTVQNAWEHSASKVLNMGASFPPKNGLNISRNYHRSPNSLLLFCFFLLLLTFLATAGEYSDPSKNAHKTPRLCSTGLLRLDS